MLLQILSYCLPSVIVAVIAYLLFQQHFKNEASTRQWLLQKDLRKEALPLRLQAYERLTLLLDRTSPQKLALRIAPTSQDKMAYELLLIEHINAEYEHNITQQIYVSGNLWNVILISKNTTLQIIHRIATDKAIGDAQKLREAIIAEFTDKPSPSTHATAHVVSEVANFI